MGHGHLILGSTIDFITGETVVDTVDERARQKVARFLVESKGYEKKEIDTKSRIQLNVDGDTGTVTVDFVIRIYEKAVMLVLFGPGSLVTRERATIAVARLLEPHIIPWAVITNGTDAEMMETRTGRVIGRGLDAILSKDDILKRYGDLSFETLPGSRREKEKRILFALDVLTRRECDAFTCSF